MASRPVPPEYLIAGQEYLDALTSLGLIPAYLGWGWEPKNGAWMFVSLFNRGSRRPTRVE